MTASEIAGNATDPEGASSEWGSERLDVDAYLQRIDHAGQLSPSAGTLRALHRAHLAAIPFENLDIVLGRTIPLDIDSLQDKLVERGRGGYCYEHNLLFAAVLERLGYAVTRLVARVRPDRSASRTHMLLRVDVDGASWIADVGFGGAVLEPLPLQHDTVARQGEWAYRLHIADDGVWLLQSLRPDGAVNLYSFTLEGQRRVDYDIINHYTSTHPNSPFTERVVAMRIEDGAHHALVNRQLTTTYPNGDTDRRSVAGEELLSTLRDTLGVHVDSPEDEARLRAALQD